MPLPSNRLKIWIAPTGTPQNIPMFPGSDWQDISESWWHEDQDIEITFGKQDEGSRADPSNINLVLDNRDGRFSPRNPLSPFYPNLSRNTPFLLTWFDGTFDQRLVSGFVTSWPLRWDRSSRKTWIPIQVNGILHRLEANQKPLRSPLYRELISRFNAGVGIVAYWPCEDGRDSNTIASAIPDVEPMIWDGEIDLASYDEFAASGPLPVLGEAPSTQPGAVGRIRGIVPPHTTTGEVSMHAMAFIDPDGFAEQRVLITFDTTGTAETWQVRYDPAGTNGGFRILVEDEDGSDIVNTVFSANSIGGLNNSQLKVSIDATQNGSNIDYTVLLFSVRNNAGLIGGPIVSDTILNHTIGRITNCGIGGLNDMGESAMGQVVIGNSTSIFTDTENVLLGWAAELAVSRLIRITDEENIPFTFERNTAFEPRMGPQGLKTVLELLRECEDADGGILFESNSFGLSYRDRASLYNQSPILELDVEANDLAIEPESTDDDQQLINLFEAERVNGSSFIARNQESIDEVDLYDDFNEFNVWRDNQLPSIAHWIVHLGTVEEMRFPAIDMQLANTPIHIDQLIALRSNLGSRITVKHNIPQLVGNEIDVQVVGWSESIGDNLWSIRFNTRPASPWKVATFEHDFSESVVLNPNPDVEQNIDGWEALNGTLAHSDVFSQSGDFSIELTPDTTGEAQINQTIATASDVTPGKTYRLSAWIRLTEKPLDCGLLFTTFDADFVPTVNDSSPLVTNVPIDTWTFLSYTTTAPDDVVLGIIKVRFLGTLTSADVCYADLITLRESIVIGNRFSPTNSQLTVGIDSVDTIFNVDTISGPIWTTDPADLPFDIKIGGEIMTVISIANTTSPQIFTVDRSVNSVVKSHDAGSSVELANPAIFARGAQI